MRDRKGCTPLVRAIESHQKDVVVFLIASGADINARDDTGRSLLAHARDMGTRELVDMLVERGAID